MPKKSAGILLYRFQNHQPEFLLVHPGGPFWAKKDKGAWSVPKGEFNEPETALQAAQREFFEETGTAVTGEFIDLTSVRMKSGKVLYVFALEHDLDASTIKSNPFSMEWPPKSGRIQEFPEIDMGAWFNADTAREKISGSQVSFINQLMEKFLPCSHDDLRNQVT